MYKRIDTSYANGGPMATVFIIGGLLCLNLDEQFSLSTVRSKGPSLRIQTDHRLVEIMPDPNLGSADDKPGPVMGQGWGLEPWW